jgi:hypothetical protein
MTSYGGIDTETMLKKWEVTSGMYEDPSEMMDNYYRNTLINNGPDKIILASDEKRTNTHSIGKLNLLHTGNRSNIEPIHNDLFLGHTEKDPRGNMTAPDMRKHTKQIWHRTKNYEKIFTSDADPSIPSEGVNPIKAIQNVRNAQFGSKKYLKIFDTSVDGMHRGYNGMPESKPIGKKVENTNITLDLNDIKNIEGRRGWTTKKSFDTPFGYQSTPDHKFKVAKYGNSGKSADINNTNIRKNKSNIKTDTKESFENKGNAVTKALILVMGNIVRDKKKSQDPSLNTQLLGDSSKNQSRQVNKNNIIDKTKESEDIIKSHTMSKLIEEVNKNFTLIGNKNIVKNKQQVETDIIVNKINQSEISNKTSANIDAFILSQVMDKIIQENDKKCDNKGNNKNSKLYSHISPELCKNMNKTKYDTKIENKGIYKKNSDDYKFHKYKNKGVEKYNKVSKDMEGIDMKAVIKKSSDKSTQNRQIGQIGHENNNKDDFIIDQDYNISGVKDRHSGKKIKHNMIRHVQYDQAQDTSTDKERPSYSKK